MGQFHASARRIERGTQGNQLIYVKRPSQQDDDREVQLGRNLAAVFISTWHGISLDYARKRYARPAGR